MTRALKPLALGITTAVVTAGAVALTANASDPVGSTQASSGTPKAQLAATKRGPRGPRGPRGFRGPAGPAGPAGAAGATGPAGITTITTVSGPASFQCSDGGGACQVASSNANCPAGTSVIGGGFDADTPDDVVSYSQRVGNGWGVIATNYFPAASTVTAQAICVSGPGIALARAARSASGGEFDAKLDRVRAAIGKR